MANFLMLRGFTPLIVLVSIPICKACFAIFRHKLGCGSQQRPLNVVVAEGACAWLPLSLFLTFCLTAGVSKAAFQAWNCIDFVDDTELKSFLRWDLSVQCSTEAHNVIISVAWALVAIWPIGMVLLYAALLYPFRRVALAESSYPMLYGATSFLHRDYKPP